MIEVVTLGTGSAIPTHYRNLSATALIRNGDVFLFDCGEGTQIQYRRAGLKPGKLKKIFISHFHGDHIFGLPGLLTSLHMAECSQSIQIYGPEGIKKYIDFHKQFAGFTLSYPLEIIEIKPGEDQKEFCLDGFSVHCQPLKHRVYCLGYAIVELPRPGKFNPEAAEKLGIKAGPLYGRLQNGIPITREDGSVIHPEQVVGPARAGHHFAYCLDTSPSDACVELSQNADVLVHDATFYSKNDDIAKEAGHSTASEAAEIAKKAGVAHLILTHFSARTLPQDEAELLDEARVIFPNSYIARDLARFRFEYPD